MAATILSPLESPIRTRRSGHAPRRAVGLAPALSRRLPVRRAGGARRAVDPAGVAAADRAEPGGRHLPARAGEDPGPAHRDAGRHGLAQPRAAALPRADRRSRKGAPLRRGGRVAGHPLGAAVLRAVRDLLASPFAPSRDPGRPAPAPFAGAIWANRAPPFSLRSQSYVELDRRWLAVTRRTALDSPDPPTSRTPRTVSSPPRRPHLLALSEDLPRSSPRHPLPALARQPAAARGAALCPLRGRHPDLPPAPAGRLTRRPAAAPRSRRGANSAARRSGRRSSPTSSTSGSTSPARRARRSTPASTSISADRGWSRRSPCRSADASLGTRGIVGADLTFDIDWEAFARRIDPPMIAGVVHLAAAAGAEPSLGGASKTRFPEAGRRRCARRSRRLPPRPLRRGTGRPRACPMCSTAWSRGRGRWPPSRSPRRHGWWSSSRRRSRTCRWSPSCSRP